MFTSHRLRPLNKRGSSWHRDRAGAFFIVQLVRHVEAFAASAGALEIVGQQVRAHSMVRDAHFHAHRVQNSVTHRLSGGGTLWTLRRVLPVEHKTFSTAALRHLTLRTAPDSFHHDPRHEEVDAAISVKARKSSSKSPAVKILTCKCLLRRFCRQFRGSKSASCLIQIF
jgi:hypothetical protein